MFFCNHIEHMNATPKAIKLDLPWDQVEEAASKDHRRAKNWIEVLVLKHLGLIAPQELTGTVAAPLDEPTPSTEAK